MHDYIRTDNGAEFLLPEIYATHGILPQTSCVKTPEQNSIVERKHSHILNLTRSLRYQAHISKSFWLYAISHAVHLVNRLPLLVTLISWCY